MLSVNINDLKQVYICTFHMILTSIRINLFALNDE